MDIYRIPNPDIPTTLPSPTAPRHRSLIVAIAVSAILGVGGGAVGVWSVSHLLRPGTAAITSAQQTKGAASGLPSVAAAASAAAGNALDAQSLAAAVDPAIVDINTVISSTAGTGQGAATGLILTSTGEILTNNHVVEGATSITITIPGRSRTYSATVVGVDPSADVALIKVTGASGLPTVKLSSAQTGESIVALGNALGKGGSPTVTQGTITATDQSLTATDDSGNAEQLSGMLETDAGIVPGDSGGALMDSNGNVVGMITAGSANGFRFQTSGAGYAVPATTALNIVNRIRAGQAGSDIILGQPGYVGVVVAEMDPAIAAQLGVTSGVSIGDVQSGSPAARAGIAAGAVITTVGLRAVGSVSQLGAAIHTHHPGESIAVTWVDSTGTHTSRLVLVSGPAI